MKESKIKIKLRVARASIDAATINEKERTVDVIFATETPVEQYVLGEYGMEVLRCQPENVDLGRFETDVVPLLDSHGKCSVKEQLGKAFNPTISDGKARCTLKISKRKDVEGVWDDIKDGLIKGISCGYRVTQYMIDRTLGEIPFYYATKWEPREISLASVPADKNSNIRFSGNEEEFECEIINKIRTEMTEEEKLKKEAEDKKAAEQQRTVTEEKPPVEKIDLEKERVAAIESERQRSIAIAEAVRASGLETEFSDQLIKQGVSLDKARVQIIDKLAENQKNTQIKGSQDAQTRVGEEAIEKTRTCMQDALSHRANGGELTEQGRQYRGMNLIRMAEEVLRVRNINVYGMSQRQIAERALSTSDFPIILGNTVNRVLRAQYELYERTFMPICRRGSAKDFRTMTKTQLSGLVDSFNHVPEGGEYEMTKMNEAGESYKVFKYGRIVPITWETLINDDMDAFSRIPTAIANKAAQKQSDIVWGILTANAAMSDGTALFHADHGNLASSGATISEITLSAARLAMRNQTSLEGDYLNLRPQYLIVGNALETTAQKIIQAVIVATKDSDTNVFKGSMNIIVEPRITGNQWYVFASSNMIDTIEYSFLDGEDELFTEQKQGFEVDGMQIKARMVFGAKAIDWRGMYKNPGA